jgi:hypothetical protein
MAVILCRKVTATGCDVLMTHKKCYLAKPQLLDKFARYSSGIIHLGSAKGKTVHLCGNT